MTYRYACRVIAIMATTSPYAKYYYGFTMGVGRRIAMEIRDAVEKSKLHDIVT